MLSAEEMASLHNHTSRGSLLDSTLEVDELVEQAKAFGYKAVAITEHGNLFTYVDFYKKCKKEGIKPIIGCEIYETSDMHYKESDADRFHLLLLAKNETGLKNLFKIVSAGHTDGFYTKPRVDRDFIKKHSEGLIGTSACLASRLMRLLHQGYCPCCRKANNEHDDECELVFEEFEPKWDEAKAELEIYKNIFGKDFYLEIQSHDTFDQMIGNQRILELAKMTDTKTVLTFDSHMLNAENKTLDIHAKFIQISQSGREVGETYRYCCQQDMETIYDILGKQISIEDLEQAILNTGAIADQCNVEIELGNIHMPHIKVPKAFKNEMEYLKHLVEVGYKERGLHQLPVDQQKVYKDRIEEELEVLEKLSYQGYFLMLKEIIQMIIDNAIPYGYSRGSGGNCLVLWLLGVTEVDSIKWNLDFSRFANLGRRSMADFDLDTSKRQRGEVLNLTENHFGHDKVSHICTFNSLSAKVCIRDLGKVFHEEGTYQLPYKVRDKIAKLIPTGSDIGKAMEQSQELRRYAEKYPLLFEYTKALENKPKSVGCHASAIIIANKPVLEYGSVMLNKDGRPMLQLDMKNAEEVGLLKFDYLGLNSLDTVSDTLKFAGLTWNDINLQTLNLNDQNVFKEIYATGNTLGVFQMESYVAQGLCREVNPDHIEDIFAINAMNRPAILSAGMQNVYIKNKREPSGVTYLHQDLKRIFEPTYGIMLYQEQALQVLRLAKFAEEEVDTGRRAIGKKLEEVMAKLKEQFYKGLKDQGWSDEQIEELWDLLEKQSTYSFNKGHSSAYGLLSYVMAYLKYYYPTEFMCALLISEIGDYEQTSLYMDECNRMGIKVLPPSINKSDTLYAIGEDKEILFGFWSIKGIGERTSEVILEERKNGEFTSLKNFLDRCEIDMASVVSLIKAGAFGQEKIKLLKEFCKMSFDYKEYKPVKTLPPKKRLVEYELLDKEDLNKKIEDKDAMLDKYNDWKKKGHIAKQKEKYIKHYKEFKKKYMTNAEMFEFETISIFLNGSPFDDYTSYFKPFNSFLDGADKVLIGGTIVNIDRKKGKKGQYAYVEVLTLHGIYEGMAFYEVYQENHDLLQKGENVVMLVKKNGEQFIIQKMKPFDQWKYEIERKKQKEQKKR